MNTRGTFMACTWNALLLGIQTITVHVFQKTMCELFMTGLVYYGFPFMELVPGPGRKFCHLPYSMFIGPDLASPDDVTKWCLTPYNVLQRERR